MCSFEIPDLLYYAFFPTLFASFLLGLLIYTSNSKSLVNRNLTYFIIFFCFWSIDSLLTWIIHEPNWNLFIERLSTLEILSLIFFLFFAYAFANIELTLRKKIAIILPFIPIILFLFTDLNYYIVNAESCEVQNGILYYYAYPLSIFYTAWAVKILWSHLNENDDDMELKKQVKLIIGAILFLVTWFLSFILIRFFLIAQGVDWSDNLSLLLPFGMVIFIGILAYAITKYKMFNIRMIAAQVLVFALVVLIGSQFFFIKTNANRILTTITLTFASGFGYMLIRSVKEDIRRKEELQMMADKLAIANDELRKLDNAKSEFISIASHQLRTPLTAIKGFLSLVLEGTYGETSVAVTNALSKVYISAENLIHLVEDLLNVSRIESGRMDFKLQKESIEPTLHDLYDNFMLVARERNLFLDLKLPKTPLPEIMVDISKVREVISNLIDNALKYTQEGGVTVRAEFIRTEVGDSVRVIIQDTGIGVPASEIPYLFKKFSRGKDINRLHAGGTGLGLYVGKNIIEAHGGKIWLESEGEGKGSKFIIELPAGKTTVE